MKKLMVIIACLGLILFSGTSWATTIYFDDVPGTTTNPATNSFAIEEYEGFMFSGFSVMSNARYRYDPYSNTYDFPSNDFAIFNSNGSQDAIIKSLDGSSFLFSGANFWGMTAYENQSGTYTALSITIQAWEDGSLKGDPITKALYVGTDLGSEFTGNSWLGFNLTADELHFSYSASSEFAAYWMMDNFDPGPVLKPNGQVPEPVTLMLIGAGLLGLGLARRKFK